MSAAPTGPPRPDAGRQVRLLRLDDGDNVYLATADLQPGEHLCSTGQLVAVVEPVGLGHKVAARTIAAGDQVVRFGMPIGSATERIGAGAWVHTHNLRSDYIVTYDTRGGDGR